MEEEGIDESLGECKDSCMRQFYDGLLDWGVEARLRLRIPLEVIHYDTLYSYTELTQINNNATYEKPSQPSPFYVSFCQMAEEPLPVCDR
jgi:hypothetical protein